jgi:hypothetical protein
VLWIDIECVKALNFNHVKTSFISIRGITHLTVYVIKISHFSYFVIQIVFKTKINRYGKVISLFCHDGNTCDTCICMQ